jgi:hypothetical protein
VRKPALVPTLLALVMLGVSPVQAEPKHLEVPHATSAKLGTASAVPSIAPGDGNACVDNTVVNTSHGILKVKACVGFNGAAIYSYSYWRCGKPAPQSGYQTCNFGIHGQGIYSTAGFVSVVDDAVIGVQTKVWRGQPFCGVSSSGATITKAVGVGTLANVRFADGYLVTNHNFHSDLQSYPTCA